jgi:segregation and condensation protein B
MHEESDAAFRESTDCEADAVAAPGEAPPLEAVLEALLFAAAAPVPLNRLARVLSPWPRAAVTEALDKLGRSLEAGGRGVRLIETGGGFQLRSGADAAPWVRRLFAERPPRLTRATLETLAIVAYRQPVTRGEVESIRGVNCDAVLGALLARRLVQVVGRRQSPGRPVEYGTTGEFLELFSLRDLSELPPLPDPAALADLATTSDSFEEEGLVERATAEDSEPGGDCIETGGGGADPLGPGEGERPGDPRAGNQGGSGAGQDHS